MPLCAVEACPNHRTNFQDQKKVTYHIFPADLVLKSRWIGILSKSSRNPRWKPTLNTFVCSNHFKKSDLNKIDNFYWVLKKGAVPCKLLTVSSNRSLQSSLHQASKTNSYENKEHEELDNNSIENMMTSSTDIKDEDDNMVGYTDVKRELMSSDDEDEPLHNKIRKKSINTKKSANTRNSPSSTHTSNSETKLADYESGNESLEEVASTEEFSDDLDSLFDSPLVVQLRQKLDKKSKLLLLQQKQNKTLRQKASRYEKKLSSYKQLVDALKKQNTTYKKRLDELQEVIEHTKQ